MDQHKPCLINSGIGIQMSMKLGNFQLQIYCNQIDDELMNGSLQTTKLFNLYEQFKWLRCKSVTLRLYVRINLIPFNFFFFLIKLFNRARSPLSKKKKKNKNKIRIVDHNVRLRSNTRYISRLDSRRRDHGPVFQLQPTLSVLPTLLAVVSIAYPFLSESQINVYRRVG